MLGNTRWKSKVDIRTTSDHEFLKGRMVLKWVEMQIGTQDTLEVRWRKQYDMSGLSQTEKHSWRHIEFVFTAWANVPTQRDHPAPFSRWDQCTHPLLVCRLVLCNKWSAMCRWYRWMGKYWILVQILSRGTNGRSCTNVTLGTSVVEFWIYSRLNCSCGFWMMKVWHVFGGSLSGGSQLVLYLHKPGIH